MGRGGGDGAWGIGWRGRSERPRGGRGRLNTGRGLRARGTNAGKGRIGRLAGGTLFL